MTKSNEAKEIEIESQKTQNRLVTSPTNITRQFNKNENIVVRTLYRYGQPLTIRKIAQASELSSDKVSEAIRTLKKDEFLFSEDRNGKTYWNLNYTR